MDKKPLTLLSVVIPARDEEVCIASTVEHLHVELRLHNVRHEIIGNGQPLQVYLFVPLVGETPHSR